MSKNLETIEKVRTSWGSDNDGAGTGMDSDKLDGLSSEDFMRDVEIPVGVDPDAMVTTGLYAVSGVINPPIIKTDGHITVTANATHITQLWSNDTEVAIRSQISGAWSNWLQLGTMTFDGTVLRVAL